MKNNAKHFMSYALQMFCMKYAVTSIVIVIFFMGLSYSFAGLTEYQLL